MIKVVPDTNVLVSAFISEGNEYEIIKLAKLGKIELVISNQILEEFNKVISRDKFGFLREQVVDFNTQLLIVCDIVEPRKKLDVVKEDVDDNMVLEAAVEVGVDYLISGDRHLLGC